MNALSPDQLSSHLKAATALEEIKDASFALIKKSLQNSLAITEFDVQQFIVSEYARHELVSSDPPIVAAGSNSRFPHYTPTAENHSPILANQPVMIDIWAKSHDKGGIYADITWMGYTGTTIDQKVAEIFAIVREARDRVTTRLTEAWNKKEEIQGWQLDRIARDYIIEQGYGDQFIHTTGHSLGEEVHADGVGLNDRSAHDTRLVVPGSLITVEPGIYIEEFGMRLELDMYVDPEHGPVITTPAQRELVVLA